MTDGLEAQQRRTKEDIVRITDELFAEDIVTATGGNVSARVPGTEIIWITPTKMFKGGLKVDDLVRVDLDGNMLEGATRPSIESPLHTGIYRAREDVNAVVHSHAPYATALGVCGVRFPAINIEGYLVSKLPLVPYAASGPDLAEAVLAVLGDWPGAFLQNHGLLTVGKDLRQAANFQEMVEHMGKVLAACKLYGGELKALPQPMLEMMDTMAAQIARIAF